MVSKLKLAHSLHFQSCPDLRPASFTRELAEGGRLFQAIFACDNRLREAHLFTVSGAFSPADFARLSLFLLPSFALVGLRNKVATHSKMTNNIL